MKLQINEEKLNEFIGQYIVRGTEPTYREVVDFVEKHHQASVDKLICANCDNEQWVCEDHPEIPFNDGDKKCCGGAGMMCKCHPNYESEQLMKDLG